jgi:hypothetical protein
VIDRSPRSLVIVVIEPLRAIYLESDPDRLLFDTIEPDKALLRDAEALSEVDVMIDPAKKT